MIAQRIENTASGCKQSAPYCSVLVVERVAGSAYRDSILSDRKYHGIATRSWNQYYVSIDHYCISVHNDAHMHY